jgi:hypothetical protein
MRNKSSHAFCISTAVILIGFIISTFAYADFPLPISISRGAQVTPFALPANLELSLSVSTSISGTISLKSPSNITQNITIQYTPGSGFTTQVNLTEIGIYTIQEDYNVTASVALLGMNETIPGSRTSTYNNASIGSKTLKITQSTLSGFSMNLPPGKIIVLSITPSSVETGLPVNVNIRVTQAIPAGGNIADSVTINATWNVTSLDISGGSGTNTPPTVTINSASQPQSNADVAVSYTLQDAQSNPCSIIAQYSKDGTSWSNATISGDITNVIPGTKTLNWKSSIDQPNGQGSYQIRIRANDGTADSAWSNSQSVTVNNSAGINNPPSVLNPRVRTIDAVTNLEPSPYHDPVTGDRIKAVYDFSDPDGNTESGSELVWVKNGVAQPKIIIQSEQDKILTQTVTRGDKWGFTITPSDGRAKGDPRSSSIITIGNAPPKAQNLTIQPFSPTANDDLKAQFSYVDAENDPQGAHEYQWYKVLPNQTQFILQPEFKTATLPASATQKGERWKFAVVPKDSLGASGTRVESASVLIANQIPIVQNLKVTGSTGDVTMTFDLIDQDGDTCSLTIWYRKGAAEKRAATIREATQGKNIITSVNPGTNIKLTWLSKEDEPSGKDDFLLGIIPNDGFQDGTEGISLRFPLNNNIAPSIVKDSAVITPSVPFATDDLIANYKYLDPNNDQESGSRIKWYRNKTEQTVYRNKNKIEKGGTKRDEEWYFTVEPSDGKEFGSITQSPTVKIKNSTPMAENVKLEPVNATSEDDLLANYNYMDADGDPQSGTEIRWYLDGIEQTKYNNKTKVPNDVTIKGQIWFYKVHVSDGTDFDEWRESNRIKLGNVAPKIVDLIFPDGDEGYRNVRISFTLVDPNDEKSTLTVEYRGGMVSQWTKATIIEPLVNISPGPIMLTWESHKDQDVRTSTQFQIRITPDDGSGVLGIPVESTFIKLDNNIPPVASNLKITPEKPTTGSNLTASYTYSDEDNGLESGSEIRWYKNDGIITDFKGNVLSSSVTARGDSWYFTVRPRDGSRFGILEKSPPVTILNTPPIINSVSILPANPKSNGTITARYDYRDIDNDRESGTEIEWYMNDELRLKKVVNSEADKINPLPISKGQKWYILVRPKDGIDFGEPLKSQSVAVDNAPPAIENIAVTVSSGNVIISFDLVDTDGDLCDLNIDYQGGTAKTSWVKATIKESTTKVTPGKEWKFTWLSQDDEHGNRADDYRIRVTPNDGTLSGDSVVSIKFSLNNNTPPSAANLAILPETPKTSDNLEAKYVFVDPDGDKESNPEIKWYKNGIAEIVYDNQPTLPSSATEKGDRWYYTIKVFDGKDYGKLQMSPDTIIANAPPTATEVRLTPEFPKLNQTLTANYQYRDADDDTEQGTKIEWYKNGVYESMYDNFATIPGAVTMSGEEWYFTVKPKDGFDFGLPVQSNKIYAGNLPPDVSSLVILPTNPLTTDNLKASYVYIDSENDPEKDSKITWFKNNVVQTKYNDMLIVPSDATAQKQVWYFTVQPKDGKQYGSLKQSNYVIIGNTPPRVSNLAIMPAYPQKGDDLIASYEYYDVDGDLEGRSEIKWYKNNVWMSAYDGLKRISSKELSDREVWHFTIRPKDDADFGSVQTSKSVEIGNPIPRINDLFIIPENPVTTDDLGAKYSYTDPNNIPESGSQITWYKNGVVQTEYNDLKFLPAKATAKGDRWNFTVKPRNAGKLFGEEQASAPVTISNSTPKLTAVVPQPQRPTTDDDIIADYVFNDADGDIEIRHDIRWYRNGVLQTAYDDLTKLSASATNRNEEWYYTVRASDGTSFSDMAVSSTVKILNGKPSISNLVIIPANPNTNDDLMTEYNYTDTENDPESGTEITWFKNDVNQQEYHNLRIAPAAATSKGEKWYCIVEPRDGIDFGASVKSQIVIIENTKPVALDITAVPVQVPRGKTVIITANGKDVDAVDFGPSMRCRIEYRINNGVWIDLTSKYVDIPTPHWETIFSPDAKATLGNYDFRTKFIDQSEAESEWFEKLSLVNVDNSLPIIDASLGGFSLKEDIITEFDLSAYGSDYESVKDVTWSLDPDSVNINLFKASILRGKILEIRPVENMNGKDDITLILTDSDGGKTEKTNVTVIVDPVNDPPTAPTIVKISPENPNTLDSLVCTASGSTDPDNDKVVYRYKWYKNDVLQTDLTAPDVHYSKTAKGETWRCEAIPSDGQVDGPSRSADVKIGNVIPSVTSIKVTGHTKDIIVTYDLEDPDGDLCDIKLEYKKDGSWKTATTSVSLLGIAPNKGLNITWQSYTDLPDIETNDCKLRISANDRVLPSTPKESETLLLDNKSPEFTITAVSNPVHKAYIDINVTSHEELKDKTPKVSAKLSELETVEIEMNNIGDKIWTGMLKLNNGFDGNVLITVNGTDLYDNSSKAELQREFKIPAPDPRPTIFTLKQNYPNPVFQDTRIPYELTESSIVVIKIYNISGELVKTIDVGYKAAGYYNTPERAALWDGKDDFGFSVASGVYFYHLKAGSSEDVMKMLVKR